MNTNAAATAATLRIAPDDLNELVRGQEQPFVDRLTPLVREQNVLLDLTRIDRVDAAGIAALISLYAAAQNAGHCFCITGARPHVAEVLAVVGLDRILLSHHAVPEATTEPCLSRSAA
ncbi:MAG TPA: STAS domain-containing protein [Terracidiphilus sp.]|nr:STAS domain-containing protein [Terracidiphilus sp.]